MALFTKSELRIRAAQSAPGGRTRIMLAESARSFSPFRRYDIFLSHCMLDAEAVLGLKLTLEDLNFTVYVDWIEDPQLDRSRVTRDSAEILRTRMKACRSLLYAASSNAENSKWMPWELGFFDGLRGKVAVAPVVDGYASTFQGQEYLSLYPWVDKEALTGLWVKSIQGTPSPRRLNDWLAAA
jgi:hypothetical protein